MIISLIVIVNAVSLKILPFQVLTYLDLPKWKHSIPLAIRKVQKIKFDYIIAYAKEIHVQDLILSLPEDNPFNALKQTLVKKHHHLRTTLTPAYVQHRGVGRPETILTTTSLEPAVRGQS